MVTTQEPGVKVMQWPARTCRACFHQDCMRRRREFALPCVVCDSKVKPGEFYRVVSTVEGEIVSIVHHEHDRRRFDR